MSGAPAGTTALDGGSRSGTVTILVLVMLLICFLFGLFLLDEWSEAVVRRQGMAIAEAVAIEALYLEQLPEYNPLGFAPYDAGNHADPSVWTQLVTIANQNGYYPTRFEPLAVADLEVTWRTASMTVHSKDPGLGAIRVEVAGVPVHHIGAGERWAEAGAPYGGATGVFPLGIKASAVPGITPFGSTDRVMTNDASADLFVLDLPGSTVGPNHHYRYFDFDPTNGVNGSNSAPPPALGVGTTVDLIPYSVLVDSGTPPHLLPTIQRIDALRRHDVIMPILADGANATQRSVVGFALLRPRGIQHTTNAVGEYVSTVIRLQKAPSRIVRSWLRSTTEPYPAPIPEEYGAAMRTVTIQDSP